MTPDHHDFDVPLAATVPAPPSIHGGLVASGFLVLLTAGFFDNVRGPFLPVIQRELGITYGMAGLFLVVGQGISIPVTLALLPALKHWGARALTLAACGIGLFGAVLALGVATYPMFLVLAAVIGSVIAVCGTMSNILVLEGTTPAVRGRWLSGLHTMYGLASVAGPLSASVMIKLGMPWTMLFLANIPLLGLTIFVLWFWGKRPENPPESGVARPSPDTQRPLESPRSRIEPLHVLAVVLFGVYVVGEVVFSMWLATYLVESRGFDIPTGSLYTMLFFIVLTITRGACWLWVTPKIETPVLWASILLPLVLGCIGLSGVYAVLPLVGLLGPFFPLLLNRVTHAFPDQWTKLTVWLMVFIELLIGVFHLALGHLIDLVGMHAAFRLPFVFQALAAILLGVFLVVERRRRQGRPVG